MRQALPRALRTIREHIILIGVCFLVSVAVGNLWWASAGLRSRLEDHILYGERAAEADRQAAENTMNDLKRQLEEERSERRVLELKIQDLRERFMRSACMEREQ